MACSAHVQGMIHLDLQNPWRLLLPKSCVKLEGPRPSRSLQNGLDFARDSHEPMKAPGHLAQKIGQRVDSPRKCTLMHRHVLELMSEVSHPRCMRHY